MKTHLKQINRQIQILERRLDRLILASRDREIAEKLLLDLVMQRNRIVVEHPNGAT